MPAKGQFPKGLNTSISVEAHIGVRGVLRHFEDLGDETVTKCEVVDAIIRIALADPEIRKKVVAEVAEQRPKPSDEI
jgi:hypothetical protein